MAKYSYEFKKKVVQAYLNGEGGQGYLMKKYGISAKKRIQEWIAVYEQFGDEGLMRSRKNESYTFEYKLHVVELYLSSELSYQELARQENIKNPKKSYTLSKLTTAMWKQRQLSQLSFRRQTL